MFFSHDILQRRGGKFGIIWIAATKSTLVPLSRRDYCAVGISKTCDDIVKYICLEAPPLKPHGPRPRLSLYLSSQLMFGVARVYGKQMEYLNAEVQELYLRFATTKWTQQTTEGTDFSQLQLLKSNKAIEFCTLQNPVGDTDDSAFGAMSFHERSVDPSKLPYIDFIQDVSPLFPVYATSEHSTSPQQKVMNGILQRSPHTVSSASEISIKEVPELPTLLIPGEADLPEIDEQIENFIDVVEPSREIQVEESMKDTISQLILKDAVSEDGEKTVERTGQSVGHIAPESTLKDFEPQQIGTEEEAVVQPESMTPTHPTQVPDLHLSPLLTSPVFTSPSAAHRPRGRRLFSMVVDDNTQLSKPYIRNNMATSSNLCYTPDQILPAAPSLTAKELFKFPGRRSLTMSKTLMALWKSKAVPNLPAKSKHYPIVRSDASSATDESPVTQVKGPEQEIIAGSPEQLRDISVESAGVSRLEETPATLTFSDLSRLSESRDSTQPSSFQLEHIRQKRRLTEQSIKEEISSSVEKLMELPDTPQVEPLQDIPEAFKSPERSSSEEDQIIRVPHLNVIREIAELTAVDDTITFTDLVPLTATCSRASKVFSVCLEYATLKLIVVWQKVAYGDVYMKRGELF